jgi:hypothetical protein
MLLAVILSSNISFPRPHRPRNRETPRMRSMKLSWTALSMIERYGLPHRNWPLSAEGVSSSEEEQIFV